MKDKLTESNFTLGALSPESAELIGELDPVLGSIVAPAQPNVHRESSIPTFGSLLSEGSDASNSSPRDLSDTDFDLGFYFGGSGGDSRSEAEEVEEDSTKTRPPSATGSNHSLDLLSEQLEASLEDMIQTAQMHPRSLQVSFISFFSNESIRLESFGPN